jgi:CRP/FNR family transcriptional regulator, cyclic AMP receptor protein
MFKHALWSMVQLRKGKEKTVTEILRNIPVFQGLSRFELSFVVPILHKRFYSMGECVFREGEAGNGMYIIESGLIKICSQEPDKPEVVYAQLMDQQFFGELSLVDGATRSATAIAEKDTVIFGFFKPDLMELIRKNSDLGAKILLNLSGVLAERLRTMNAQVLALNTEIQNLRNN